MRGLLDYIFNNIEERNLDQTRITAYIRYLYEIILNGLPIEKELEYHAIKLRLLKRISDLNQQQVKFYLKNPGEQEINDEK